MTKTTCLLLLAALGGCTSPQQDTAPTGNGEEASPSALGSEVPATVRAQVLATVQRLFDALETGDEALLRAVMDPDVVMHFWEEDVDGSSSAGQATVDGLAARITSSDVPLIERMWDPEVRLSGALATVWTPYDFYAGEVFSHCGVDQVSLMLEEGEWRIVGLSWTRQQPPECELHPDGAPGR